MFLSRYNDRPSVLKLAASKSISISLEALIGGGSIMPKAVRHDL